MPVEPTNRIYEPPLIRRGERIGLPSKKKQKKEKKESEKGERKIDIKI